MSICISVLRTSVGGVPHASFDGVPEDRTTSKIRDIDPKLVAKIVGYKIFMHVMECHPFVIFWIRASID
jgi:hypothetical protein